MKSTTKKAVPVNEMMLAVPYSEGHYRFWERRMHLDDIFIELHLPYDTEYDVMEMAYAIIDYCKTNKVMPLNISWGVDHGLLYADNNPIKRVGPKWA